MFRGSKIQILSLRSKAAVFVLGLSLFAAPHQVFSKDRVFEEDSLPDCAQALHRLTQAGPPALPSSRSTVVGELFEKTSRQVHTSVLQFFRDLHSEFNIWRQRPTLVQSKASGESKSSNDTSIQGPTTVLALKIDFIKSILRKVSDEEQTNHFLNVIKFFIFQRMVERGIIASSAQQDYKNLFIEMEPKNFNEKLVTDAVREGLWDFDHYLERFAPKIYEAKRIQKETKNWISVGYVEVDSGLKAEAMSMAYMASQFSDPQEVVINFRSKINQIQADLFKIESLRADLVAYFESQATIEEVYGAYGLLEKVSVSSENGPIQVSVLKFEINEAIRKAKNMDHLKQVLKKRFRLQKDIPLNIASDLINYYERAQKFHPPFAHENLLHLELSSANLASYLKPPTTKNAKTVISFDMSGVGIRNSQLIQAQLAVGVRGVDGRALMPGEIDPVRVISPLNYGSSRDRMVQGLDLARKVVQKVAGALGLKQEDIQARLSGDELSIELVKKLAFKDWAEILRELPPDLRGTLNSLSIKMSPREIGELRDVGEEAAKVLKAHFSHDPRTHRLKIGASIAPLKRIEAGRLSFALTLLVEYSNEMSPSTREEIRAMIREGRFRKLVREKVDLSPEVLKHLSVIHLYEISSESGSSVLPGAARGVGLEANKPK